MAQPRLSPEAPLTKPRLSIVIPAFNEEARIRTTLDQVIAFLVSRPYTWEIVVADDGSTDATARLVSELADGRPELKLLRLPHRGKGWAVKHGMLAAVGEYRFLCDADLSMPIEQVERFLPPQVGEGTIVVGSREAPNSRRIGEPAHRHFMGRLYNRLVRLAAVPGISDTQCGFKCFPGEQASALFQRQRTNGFAFDVEILFLARRSGLKVTEIGIDWYFREESKIRPLLDSVVMTRDLIKIRWLHRRWRRG